MTIFEAIYNLIQAGRQALLDILQPLIMPDWGWLVTVVLPLTFAALVILYFVYLFVSYRRVAPLNVDRRPRRLASPAAPPPGVHPSVPSWWPIALSVGFFLALLGLVASVPLLAIGLVMTLAGGWGWLHSATREWRRTDAGAEHGPARGLLPAETGARGAAVGPVPPSRALVPSAPSAVTKLPAGYPEAHAAGPPEGLHMPTPSWWPVYASLAAFFALLGLVVNLALLVGGLVLTLLAVIGWYVDAYRELKVAEGIAQRRHVRDPLAIFPRILAAIGASTVVLAVAFAAGPGVVAQLFPAQGAGSGGPGGPPCTPTAAVEITAKDTAFSTRELCLPADTPFQVVFHNEDAGIQHNVAIGTLFNGAVFAGVATERYDVPALPAGSYRFICVVHPTVMIGTATVVAAGSPPPGGTPPTPGP